MRSKILLIITVISGAGLALSIPTYHLFIKPHSIHSEKKLLRNDIKDPTDELPSSATISSSEANTKKIFVGIGISPDRSIAQSKAKMNAYYKLAQSMGLNTSPGESHFMIIKNTRILRYKVYKKGKNFIYECYIQKLP